MTSRAVLMFLLVSVDAVSPVVVLLDPCVLPATLCRLWWRRTCTSCWRARGWATTTSAISSTRSCEASSTFTQPTCCTVTSSPPTCSSTPLATSRFAHTHTASSPVKMKTMQLYLFGQQPLFWCLDCYFRFWWIPHMHQPEHYICTLCTVYSRVYVEILHFICKFSIDIQHLLWFKDNMW